MYILLASGSPRRRELLSSAQIDFNTLRVDIDEALYKDESPLDYIQRMVAVKADAAIEQLIAEDRLGLFNQILPSSKNAQSTKADLPFLILTADTIGVLPDGQTVLVKPVDRAHAYSMWQSMSDNTHQVWTAVQTTLVDQSLQVLWKQQILERTEVTFVPLTAEIMSNYWDSGEPADKAGGYAIQGLAAAWVTRINGSYTNVVGLPLAQTLSLINQANQYHKSLKGW